MHRLVRFLGEKSDQYPLCRYVEQNSGARAGKVMGWHEALGSVLEGLAAIGKGKRQTCQVIDGGRLNPLQARRGPFEGPPLSAIRVRVP